MSKTLLPRLSIFIDAGHYNAIQKFHEAHFDFPRFINEVRTRLHDSIGTHELLHTFYYDCLLPFSNQTPETQAAAVKRSSYFQFLKSQPGIIVREGTMRQRTDPDGQITYQQKTVDLLIGLDIACECEKNYMTHLLLITGDMDLLPAVEHASTRGIQTWLVHAPLTAGMGAIGLWSAVDGRIEVDEEFARRVNK